MVDALSRKSIHMLTLMVRELELIEQFRDMSMVCEMTSESVMMGMLKLNNELLNEIREKLDVKLVDLLPSENASANGDFKVDEYGVLRF